MKKPKSHLVSYVNLFLTCFLLAFGITVASAGEPSKVVPDKAVVKDNAAGMMKPELILQKNDVVDGRQVNLTIYGTAFEEGKVLGSLQSITGQTYKAAPDSSHFWITCG